jgi:hypothetical protein
LVEVPTLRHKSWGGLVHVGGRRQLKRGFAKAHLGGLMGGTLGGATLQEMEGTQMSWHFSIVQSNFLIIERG